MYQALKGINQTVLGPVKKIFSAFLTPAFLTPAFLPPTGQKPLPAPCQRPAPAKAPNTAQQKPTLGNHEVTELLHGITLYAAIQQKFPNAVLSSNYRTVLLKKSIQILKNHTIDTEHKKKIIAFVMTELPFASNANALFSKTDSSIAQANNDHTLKLDAHEAIKIHNTINKYKKFKIESENIESINEKRGEIIDRIFKILKEKEVNQHDRQIFLHFVEQELASYRPNPVKIHNKLAVVSNRSITDCPETGKINALIEKIKISQHNRSAQIDPPHHKTLGDASQMVTESISALSSPLLQTAQKRLINDFVMSQMQVNGFDVMRFDLQRSYSASRID